MAAVTICSHFGAPRNKSLTVSIVSPSICHEVMGPAAMILLLWMLSFKPTFSLSSFTFIKRFFHSSLLSVIRVVASAYLRLLLLLPAIWEQWPHKRLTQTCLWACRSLWWRHGSVVACCRAGGIDCGSACRGPFEGGHHYLLYLHHSLVPGHNREGTQPRPSTENWMKDLLSMALPIRTWPSCPHSQSLPSGNFYKPLILIPQNESHFNCNFISNRLNK